MEGLIGNTSQDMDWIVLKSPSQVWKALVARRSGLSADKEVQTGAEFAVTVALGSPDMLKGRRLRSGDKESQTTCFESFESAANFLVQQIKAKTAEGFVTVEACNEGRRQAAQ
jgi:3-oxoacyl-[acyl-carrier-protein] synthase III